MNTIKTSPEPVIRYIEPVAQTASRTTQHPIVNRAVIEVAALEAKMPQLNQSASRRENVSTLLWIMVGAIITAFYIGLPLAAVANEAIRTSAIDGLFAFGIVTGLALIILDILKQTSRAR